MFKAALPYLAASIAGSVAAIAIAKMALDQKLHILQSHHWTDVYNEGRESYRRGYDDATAHSEIHDIYGIVGDPDPSQ